MKKRIGSLLLTLALCLCLCPVSAFAAKSDFVIENGVLTKYNGSGGDVVIPDGVTSIDGAFRDCDSLTDVYYSGSEEQWNLIEIKNYGIGLPKNATIYYNSTGPKATEKFTDVSTSSYYADAVDWALSSNITTGTTDTTFSPKDDCTHAQILTFLWRAAGEPESNATLPFATTGKEYYLGAVKWAYGKGMIDKNFNHKTPCTRADAVSYIWQAFGKKSAGYDGRFTDVLKNSPYATAVAWALANGVTTGTSATTFTPNKICNRGEIVTFLYRAYASGGAQSDPTALLSSIAYYGDPAQCAMTADQAQAFAEVIRSQSAELEQEYERDKSGYESMSPGMTPHYYAALVDAGNGIPILIGAGGLTSGTNDRRVYWEYLSTFSIWQYVNGQAVQFQPEGGTRAAVTSDGLWVGWSGNTPYPYEIRKLDARLYPFQNGTISAQPAHTLYGDGVTNTIDGDSVSLNELDAALADYAADVCVTSSINGDPSGGFSGVYPAEQVLEALAMWGGF